MKYEINFDGRIYKVEAEPGKPMAMGGFLAHAPAASAVSGAGKTIDTPWGCTADTGTPLVVIG